MQKEKSITLSTCPTEEEYNNLQWDTFNLDNLNNLIGYTIVSADKIEPYREGLNAVGVNLTLSKEPGNDKEPLLILQICADDMTEDPNLYSLYSLFRRNNS